MKRNRKEKEQTTSVGHVLLTILGTVLCIILIPILAINILMIVKSFTNQDDVPSVGGYLPLIVLTDSMYPSIQSGDMVICHTADPNSVKEGDTIAFFDPAGDGTSIVTHRVTEITTENGSLAFRTKGDANNAEDEMSVPAENLVGIYQKRLPRFGNVAMFMQTTTGLILCVVVPLILLVAYDLLRRRHYEKNRQEDTDELLRELEELRAQKQQAMRKAAKKRTEKSAG